MRFSIVLCCLSMMWLSSCEEIQDQIDLYMPHIATHHATPQLIVDDQPFVMLAGELHNSSASSLQYLESVWPKLQSLNLNTVVAPVYWELGEPEEGVYDYTLVDGLIELARDAEMRLVLLWFGSWKNGESSYAPLWVKRDTERFFRVQTEQGKTREILSPFCNAARDADARAFTELLAYVERIDAAAHTVVMMQIQNEVGLLGQRRDHSPAADSAFAEPVPGALLEYLQTNGDVLHPEVQSAWQSQGSAMNGTWRDVFGADAEEFFMAWHFASYVDGIAAAGKAEYPIPLYVNAWLRAPDQAPGDYPSGGPIAKVHDIWRAAAPNIDMFAPDIYLPNFKKISRDYKRRDNVLFIPEAHRNDDSMAQAFYAIAEHDAIGYAPFGVDDIHDTTAMSAGYGFLKAMLPQIITHQGTGKMRGVLQEAEIQESFVLGGCRLDVDYDIYPKFNKRSYGIIIQTAPLEYLVMGSGFEVQFRPLPEDSLDVHILQVEERVYEEGEWITRRYLNGDETAAHQRVKVPVILLKPEEVQQIQESTTHPPLPLPPNEYIVQRVQLYRRGVLP